MTRRPALSFRLAAILIAVMLVGVGPAWHARPAAATGGSLTFEAARHESQWLLVTPDRSIEALTVLKQSSSRPGLLPFASAGGTPAVRRLAPHRIARDTGRAAFRRSPPLVGTVVLRI